MKALDDEIGRQLARAVAAGQLRAGAGKPLVVDEAWLQTPPGLRMAFQVLKSAGVPPAEVELFQQRASLHTSLATAGDEATRLRLQRQLAELEQDIAFRLEALRKLGQG
ncbi:DnaJ family domain-containing protein [Azotobacter sp. CWF10]